MSRDPARLERLIAETRRAELVHLGVWPFWLATLAWMPPWGVLINLLFATAFNLKVSEYYGVQPRFLVSLWGIETDFGRLTGGFSVISALSTLAFEGRRHEYFKKELLNALTIINEGHISFDKMTGSWAGAMGQCQFMPSSFLNYATDWNKDGSKDIWNSKPDVFASAANYLKKVGWSN